MDETLATYNFDFVLGPANALGKGFKGLCYGSSLFLMDLSTEDFFNAIPLKLAKSLCYFRGRQRQWINMPEGICVKI